ncbi:hypothetical protein AGLY_001202 [Aphis glycines]|uniref:Uncharacterized protein n=1 Tax=Aphis glycines TaxID=307491 RepID=A0A6G0UAL4_APHGL|nr:hypothetical protein AGLY_001202 [Aphis glycines]
MAPPPESKHEYVNILKKMCDTSLCKAANAYIKRLDIDDSELYKMLSRFDESATYSTFFQEKYYLIETDKVYDSKNDLYKLQKLIIQLLRGLKNRSSYNDIRYIIFFYNECSSLLEFISPQYGKRRIYWQGFMDGWVDNFNVCVKKIFVTPLVIYFDVKKDLDLIISMIFCKNTRFEFKLSARMFCIEANTSERTHYISDLYEDDEVVSSSSPNINDNEYLTVDD